MEFLFDLVLEIQEDGSEGGANTVSNEPGHDVWLKTNDEMPDPDYDDNLTTEFIDNHQRVGLFLFNYFIINEMECGFLSRSKKKELLQLLLPCSDSDTELGQTAQTCLQGNLPIFYVDSVLYGVVEVAGWINKPQYLSLALSLVC
jgi:hypothetical protein